MAISDSQRLMAKRVLSNTTGRLLRRGSTGVTVRALQAFLADKGYDVGKLDGVFGKRTQAALKTFQRDNAIAADGKAGSQTFGKIMEVFPDLAEPVAEADLPAMDVVEPVAPQAPAAEFAPPEMAPEIGAAALTRGVSSPPESVAPAPVPPMFADETFTPNRPGVPETEPSDFLGQGIDTAKAAMTGEPYANLAAERRMNVPENWEPQAGDGLDALRAALLGKINMRNAPPQVAGVPQMNPMLRALVGR